MGRERERDEANGLALVPVERGAVLRYTVSFR
jgi:hypothetical protein